MRERIFRLTEEISRNPDFRQPPDELPVPTEKRHLNGRCKISVGRRISAAAHHDIDAILSLCEFLYRLSRTLDTNLRDSRLRNTVIGRNGASRNGNIVLLRVRLGGQGRTENAPIENNIPILFVDNALVVEKRFRKTAFGVSVFVNRNSFVKYLLSCLSRKQSRSVRTGIGADIRIQFTETQIVYGGQDGIFARFNIDGREICADMFFDIRDYFFDVKRPE